MIDFKTYLTETIWGRSMNRALRKEVRKEDDVDIMGMDDFLEYLSKKYDDLSFDPGIGSIVFTSDDRSIFGCMEFKDEKNHPVDIVSKFWLDMNVPRRDYETMLGKEFYETLPGKVDQGSQLVCLVPKVGELTNSSCIRILDIINEYRER